MKPTRTAFRYAKATLAYANENKFSDKVAKEMQGLIELYDSSIQLNRLLSNPFLPNTKKQSILLGNIFCIIFKSEFFFYNKNPWYSRWWSIG